jgi:hypothetical protein
MSSKQRECNTSKLLMPSSPATTNSPSIVQVSAFNLAAASIGHG